MPGSNGPTFNLRTLVNAEAWQDPQFKEQLQQDPRAAVRSLADKYQLDLPDVDYRVTEDSQDTYTLVLSPSPAGAAPEELQSEVQGYVSLFGTPSTGLGGGTVGGKCSSSSPLCHSPVCTSVKSCISAATLG